MNIKKILLVVGFFAFILLAGFALYWVFFRSAPLPEDSSNFNAGQIPSIGEGNLNIINQNTNDSQGLPWQDFVKDKVSPVANGGLTEVSKVTDSEVRGLTSSSSGLQFYDANKQQFFRIDANGNIVTLSDKKFFQVENVTWSSSGDKAILEYPDGSNILYNFRTAKQVTLPQELEEFSFNQEANQIVAKWIGSDADSNWLIGANDDGSGMYLINPLGENAHTVEMGFSPDNQVAALHRKYTGVDSQEIYPLGLNRENLKSFKVSGAGFTSQWSPQGNSLLYSVYSETTNYNPNLWVTKGNTSELGDIKVSLNISTWPDKCTFVGENRLYCAVPQGLPRGAGFYPEVAYDYPDNIYSIDLSTGYKSLLASPVGSQGGYSAHNLFVSPDGSVLYFTDINSNTLQSIRLK